MQSRTGTRASAAALALLLTWAVQGQAATVDRVVGASSSGGSHLVKHFTVPAGSVLVGVELVSNDPRTTFPRVSILNGQARRLADARTLAQLANVQSDGRHVLRITFPPVEVTRDQDVYVAVELPASPGVTEVGAGPGLGAMQLTEPNGSYLASAADGTLQPIDVDLAISLLFQDLGKARADGGDRPTEGVARTFLGAGSPNPAAGAVTIEFGVERTMPVMLTVYDIAGRHVRNLVHESLPAGVHARSWDGRDDRGAAVATGVYVAKLRAGERVITQKLVLTK